MAIIELISGDTTYRLKGGEYSIPGQAATSGKELLEYPLIRGRKRPDAVRIIDRSGVLFDSREPENLTKTNRL